MKKEYLEIINLKRFDPKTHPRMPKEKRAAQFAPFAALTGFDAQIKETARTTIKQEEMFDDNKEIINRKLTQLLNLKNPKITVNYFEPDDKKIGGKYITKTGILNKINVEEKYLLFTDRTQIKFSNIKDIDSALFSDIDWQ